MRRWLGDRRGTWRAGACLFALAATIGGAARATEPPDETVPAAAPQGASGTVPAGAPQAPAAPADGTQAQFPFAGTTIGDDVNVRAGPGSAYEVVTQLAGGERVAVLGEAFGWLEVRPARDVAVFIHKDLIETKGAGVGVILKDRANLRSRGAQSATVVGQCAKGDVVRLLDASGDWISLAAPPEAKLYVHKDLVRAVATGEAPPAATQAAPVAAGAATPVPAPAPSPLEKLKRGRGLYNAELEKPDIDAMSFGPAALLLEEARQEATIPEVRRAAEVALKRLRAAERVQADYRARVKPIGDLLEPPPAGK